MIKLSDKKIIGEGFKHQVYSDKNVVYKVIKDSFCTQDTPEDYLEEIAALNLLRDNGFVVPDELELISPDENDLHKWCLKESLMQGAQYNDRVLTGEGQRKIFDCIISMGKISGTHYGTLTGEQRCDSWHKFLNSMLDKYSDVFENYSEIPHSLDIVREGISRYVPVNPTPCFNVMDTNVMNFFFDEKGDVCGIIDIDHPVFGDVDFIYAMIKWNRDDWFERDDWYALWIKDKVDISMEVFAIYEFILAYDDVCMRYLANREREGSTNKLIELERTVVEMFR